MFKNDAKEESYKYYSFVLLLLMFYKRSDKKYLFIGDSGGDGGLLPSQSDFLFNFRSCTFHYLILSLILKL